MYFVFDSKEDFDKAHAQIKKNMGMPIISRNALTGELEPDKQQTTSWCEVEESKDGKFCMPKPPSIALSKVEKFVEVSVVELKGEKLSDESK